MELTSLPGSVRREEDQEAYEAARAVLTEKGIDGIPGFDSLVAPGDTILTFFGYNDDGVAIFAVLPEDVPSSVRISTGKYHYIIPL